MRTQRVITEDGSHSLFVPELNEHYHSVHGAVQESMHVFIEAGLNYFPEGKNAINILEVGLGTGLNVLLTLLNAKQKINYSSLEAFPINADEAQSLNYVKVLDAKDLAEQFSNIHSCKSGKEILLNDNFYFTKHLTKLQDFRSSSSFDLVYYDAFAPKVQPELWTEDIFRQLYAMMNAGGIMVTYCAKGEVKRNMKAAGFFVEALPGPKGKREMTRASKKII